MESGLTVLETARLVEDLRWASLRLFEILGEWAGEAKRSDIAVSFATASRHMGWHSEDLDALAPDSVLVGDARSSDFRFRRIDAAMTTIRGRTDSIDNLAIAHRVLLARVASRCVAIERMATAHSDAPLKRVIGFMLADLRRDRDDGEALLERLLISSELVTRVGSAVVEAETLVVEAGGLPPSIAGN